MTTLRPAPNAGAATHPGEATAHEAVVLDAIATSRLGVEAVECLVLLSGGRDSVCLLDAARRLLGAERLRALHVNYGLRPAAADDERHCRELCGALDVSLHVEHAGPPPPGNLQAWARDVRYQAAAAIATAPTGVVASAHTATDQAETILYRLAASPGRRALLGMPSDDGRLVRPLLGVTREQTTAYCVGRGLRWREDESNASDGYARARVRLGLLPALRTIHPAAERNIARTAQLLSDEAAVLDDAVGGVLGGRDRIEVHRLAALPAALRRLVSRRLAEDATGRLVPAAATRVAELLALGRDGELHLEGGVQAIVEDGLLRFALASSRRRPARGRAALSTPPPAA